MSMSKSMSTSMRHVQVYYLGWMFMSTLDVHVSVMRAHAAYIRTYKLGHKKSEEMDTVMDMDMDVDMDMDMDRTWTWTRIWTWTWTWTLSFKNCYRVLP
jgi:hypothetical protein